MIVVGFGFGGLFAAGVVLKLVLKEKSVQVGLNPLVVCSAALIFSLSRVRGVSEWISLALGLQIIHWISSCGHSVESTISNFWEFQCNSVVSVGCRHGCRIFA